MREGSHSQPSKGQSPLRWGILGAGNIAGKMAAVFPTCSRARAVAIASRSRGRAQSIANQHQLARVYEGYEKLIGDPEVDIVYNALHIGLHAEWSIRSLEAGKHVLCEKPLARNAAEAEAMFAAARKHGRFLMEGFMYRFHPQMALMKKLLDENAIGQLKLIEAGYANPRSLDDTPKWRSECGGGALLDIGCYTVDISRLVTDESPSEIVGRCVMKPSTDVDETMVGILKFPSGCLAMIYGSFGMARTHYCKIVGERGAIELPHPWRSEEVPLPVFITRDGVREQVDAPAANPFRLQFDYFSECVAAGRPPVFPSRRISAEADSWENARALDALRRTAKSR